MSYIVVVIEIIYDWCIDVVIEIIYYDGWIYLIDYINF